MTTITVEIEADKDLSALKEFINQLGLKYQVEEENALIFTEELKNLLDNRQQNYLAGNVSILSADESQNRVQNLLRDK